MNSWNSFSLINQSKASIRFEIKSIQNEIKRNIKLKKKRRKTVNGSNVTKCSYGQILPNWTDCGSLPAPSCLALFTSEYLNIIGKKVKIITMAVACLCNFHCRFSFWCFWFGFFLFLLLHPCVPLCSLLLLLLQFVLVAAEFLCFTYQADSNGKKWPN